MSEKIEAIKAETVGMRYQNEMSQKEIAGLKGNVADLKKNLSDKKIELQTTITKNKAAIFEM